MTAVVWRAPDPSRPGRGYWDQALLEDVLDRTVWRPARAHRFEHVDTVADVPPGEGAVVVCPGAHTNIHELTADMDWLPWVLLIVTSDEENHLDLSSLQLPCREVWAQYPDPARQSGVDRYLPIGYAPGTVAEAKGIIDRVFHWIFAGQVTNGRRRRAVQQMRSMGGGVLRATGGFAQGVPHDVYMTEMGSAMAAPCPPGPYSPDSFRMWEALEAGTVPIVDSMSDRGRTGIWDAMFDTSLPFPILDDWRDLPETVQDVVAYWPRYGAICSAWWQAQKRDLAYALDDTVTRLAGTEPPITTLGDLVTVIVPTSPIPSHPDTGMLFETLNSVAAAGLVDCEVLVTCDGVRAAQADREPAYDRYVAEVVRLCEHAWAQTLPVVHVRHQHQSRMMSHALELVRTPLVLYVEHDAPLCGEFDWDGLCGLLLAGEADVIRLHHDDQLLPEHEPLMTAPETVLRGVPVRPTAQWSQRPHLASADYYRRIMADHFLPGERWMIEDRMCSVLEVARNDGQLDQHRVVIYTATNGEPGIQHSRHLDGRAGEPKWVDE